MKKRFIVPLIVMVSMASSAMNQEKEIAEESTPSSFQPKPLDDEWSKWLVGEWEGLSKSDVGTGKLRTKIELGLNGQFLIMRTEARTTEITDEQRQYLMKNSRSFNVLLSKNCKLARSIRRPAKSLDTCLIACVVQPRVKASGKGTKKSWNGNGPCSPKGLQVYAS
jgi:hypothetical protein